MFLASPPEPTTPFSQAPPFFLVTIVNHYLVQLWLKMTPFDLPPKRAWG